MQGFMGWGYMRLCCHLEGSRSLIMPKSKDKSSTQKKIGSNKDPAWNKDDFTRGSDK